LFILEKYGECAGILWKNREVYTLDIIEKLIVYGKGGLVGWLLRVIKLSSC
jgi:hypothetical protein